MLDIAKAIIARLLFACHGFLVIWQVVTATGEVRYWYLSLSLVTLGLETVFTLILKKSREWKWFCPSIFLYLSSVVPAIWLLELDKYYKGSWTYLNATREFATLNLTSLAALNLGLRMEVSEEVWVTLLEQFLMLALILGRWMLPLGTLTREQLSQLLLIHIGTAADIIEFFDSFKDDRIANKEILFFLVLSIWSWSLLQFTIIVPTSQDEDKAEKKCCFLPNNGNNKGSDGELFCCSSYVKSKSSLSSPSSSSSCFGCCCSLVVCSVFLEIVLQDAPFLVFRLLLILHYSIVSYMNVFFTAKNTLAIALQFYRLLVVQKGSAMRSKTCVREQSLSLAPIERSGRRHRKLPGESYRMEREGTECRRGISLVELSQSDPKLVEYRDDVKVRPRGEAGTSTKFPLSSFEDEASWPAQSRLVPFRQPQQLSFSEEELTWRGDTDFSLSHSPSPDEFYKAALRKKTALGIQFRGDSKPFPKRTRVSKTNRQRPHILESTCDVFAERGLRREGEMMEMKEGKRLGQDTGYSTASSPNWHTPPTDGSRGMMRKKPKLFRQEGVQEAPTFTSALYRQTSSNHCSIGSDRSGHSSHRELQSRRNHPSSPRMAPHTRR